MTNNDDDVVKKTVAERMAHARAGRKRGPRENLRSPPPGTEESKAIACYFTPGEYQDVREEAVRVGLSLSSFVRMTLLSVVRRRS